MEVIYIRVVIPVAVLMYTTRQQIMEVLLSMTVQCHTASFLHLMSPQTYSWLMAPWRMLLLFNLHHACSGSYFDFVRKDLTGPIFLHKSADPSQQNSKLQSFACVSGWEEWLITFYLSWVGEDF